ncbi:uncharacterized protein B0I36DRAFT_385986 [Microdochium trichocladiopsis]|uniref:Glucose receptor Git3 N-terminal domain-containing protein n=1 Tax=Microdochium trichocladiopsis TaxID=1682393 RepID=A0A9P8Y5N9_9PEZI|nr:uncharacterized protein B0I36DRAFT_385986 [Microdochium trichocladiopsis]KAH7028100.1 hypothetical protein B0I36DRAFT_385986 [Microdochium trichocladiopsis]
MEVSAAMETGSISPLPRAFRMGQLAVVVVGTISLVTSSLLFLHITYKLISLELRNRQAQQPHDAPVEMDLALGLSEDHYKHFKAITEPTPTASQGRQNADAIANPDAGDKKPGRVKKRKYKAPNPLLILIYNLILADISLSATYAANMIWLKEDTINIDWPTCRAQGWLVSFGCVISSAFLLTLAIYTHRIVIMGKRPSSKSTIIVCVAIWAASIVLTCIGPIASGKEHYYARQQCWCWIEGSNAGWRLTVYIPGFFCLCSTFGLYTWTFWCLHKRSQSSRMMPRSSSSSLTSGTSRGFVSSSTNHARQASKATAGRAGSISNGGLAHTPTNGNPMSSAARNSGTKLRPSGHHPAFLIYPIIYTVVASPLTLGSITPLENSTLFMITSATLLSSLGFFNALLWASTIIFSRRDDLVDTGLEYFSFMRTPSDRQYGNMIWVQGGACTPEDDGDVRGQGLGDGGGGVGSNGSVLGTNRHGEERSESKHRWYLLGRGRNGSDSEIPLRVQPSRASSTQRAGPSSHMNGADASRSGGGGIRLDVSTTVVVEDSKALQG